MKVSQIRHVLRQPQPDPYCRYLRQENVLSEKSVGITFGLAGCLTRGVGDGARHQYQSETLNPLNALMRKRFHLFHCISYLFF